MSQGQLGAPGAPALTVWKAGVPAPAGWRVPRPGAGTSVSSDQLRSWQLIRSRPTPALTRGPAGWVWSHNRLVSTVRTGTRTLLAVSLALALGLAGCGTTGHPHHKSHPSPSQSPSATPSPSPTPTASASAPAAPVCQSASVAAGLGPSNNAAGHQAWTIVLTNDSAATCSLDGFPTLQLMNGSTDVSTTQTDGNSPPGAQISDTPTLVNIAPDTAASFVVQWLDVPTGSQECNAAYELGITLPGGGGKVTAAIGQIMPCGGDLYVSPVRAGTATP
jgi:Protein of unknown function (DUF4232)